MKLLLNIVRGPSEPHGKLQRPSITRFVDNTVYVDIPDVFLTHESVRERREHLARELGSVHVAEYRALLASCDALIAIHELFKLPILLPPADPTVRAEPPADAHLDTGNELLKQELVLLPEPLPLFEHIDHIGR